jgi:hypothetical protein
MQYVWVLVFYMSGSSHNGGPAVIDNIATKEECVRVSEIVMQSRRADSARCIEVRKVRGN